MLGGYSAANDSGRILNSPCIAKNLLIERMRTIKSSERLSSVDCVCF